MGKHTKNRVCREKVWRAVERRLSLRPSWKCRWSANLRSWKTVRTMPVRLIVQRCVMCSSVKRSHEFDSTYCRALPSALLSSFSIDETMQIKKSVCMYVCMYVTNRDRENLSNRDQTSHTYA
ncbi:hypothetical protein Y032_0007g3402 [Ancylostoma ceylanicum]|uniref:Uncharacterized protein n=1 Tax=Ancylostoma ceylanicum TaxID=53326 RepID=A0A016VMV6_9BILA|nr:hypothetical protein Y032_0007g3402 [Ancylostoma ceylanicum]